MSNFTTIYWKNSGKKYILVVKVYELLVKLKELTIFTTTDL